MHIVHLNPSCRSCWHSVVESRKTDLVLVTCLVVFFILGCLATNGQFNAIMGVQNAAYFSYGLYAAAVILLIAEATKITLNCLHLFSRKQPELEREYDLRRLNKVQIQQLKSLVSNYVPKESHSLPNDKRQACIDNSHIRLNSMLDSLKQQSISYLELRIERSHETNMGEDELTFLKNAIDNLSDLPPRIVKPKPQPVVPAPVVILAPKVPPPPKQLKAAPVKPQEAKPAAFVKPREAKPAALIVPSPKLAPGQVELPVPAGYKSPEGGPSLKKTVEELKEDITKHWISFNFSLEIFKKDDSPEEIERKTAESIKWLQDYMFNIVENAEFQNNPEAFIKAWQKHRGKDDFQRQGLYFPESSALAYFITFPPWEGHPAGDTK